MIKFAHSTWNIVATLLNAITILFNCFLFSHNQPLLKLASKIVIINLGCRLAIVDNWALAIHELEAWDFAQKIHASDIGPITRRICHMVAKGRVQNQWGVDDRPFYVHEVVKVLFVGFEIFENIKSQLISYLERQSNYRWFKTTQVTISGLN